MSQPPPDFFGDVDRLRLPDASNREHERASARSLPAAPKATTRNRIKGEFLKGPIPLAWLSKAARLRAKSALAVALAIWFESGRRRSPEVKLTTKILERFGVNRKAKYRALTALEREGLIVVTRMPRRNPVVVIQEAFPGSDPLARCSGD
jgi:hypothetical protein